MSRAFLLRPRLTHLLARKSEVTSVSLSTKNGQNRDATLAEFFDTVQKQIDAETGSKFRASRPDAFEVIDNSVVAEAVESPEKSPVLGATSKLCFVLMPFSEKFDAVYRTLIAPAVTELGLTVVRADELSSPGSIIEQIRVAIQQARLCVVDLTGNNANVMYELGLAQAAGKPTILLSQDISRLPFDVGSQRIIVYDGLKPESSQSHLRAALKTVLSSDRLAKAELLFASGHYRAAILEAFIVLDVGLRQLATKNHLSQKDNVRPTMMRDVIASLAQSKILTSEQRNALGNVQQIRNKAVHIPDEPPEQDAKLVIDASKQFLPLFDAE